MTNKKTSYRKSIKKASSTRREPRHGASKKHHSYLPSFFLKYPRWAWWFGGFLVLVVYVWVFYYFFVGPTGFRWRALYGDVAYPEGYE